MGKVDGWLLTSCDVNMVICTSAGCSGVRTRGLVPGQDQSHGGCHEAHYRGVRTGVTSKNGSLTPSFLTFSPLLIFRKLIKMPIPWILKHLNIQLIVLHLVHHKKINRKMNIFKTTSLHFRKAKEQAVNVWLLLKSFELCTFHWLILTLIFIACCDNSHKSTFLVYIESSIKSGHQGSLDSKWIYNKHPLPPDWSLVTDTGLWLAETDIPCRVKRSASWDGKNFWHPTQTLFLNNVSKIIKLMKYKIRHVHRCQVERNIHLFRTDCVKCKV